MRNFSTLLRENCEVRVYTNKSLFTPRINILLQNIVFGMVVINFSDILMYAMRKRGLCCRKMAGWMSVIRRYFVSKRQNLS